MLSEIFFTFLVTSIIACFLGTARMLYKSKCRSVECCGFKIERDTGAEEKVDEIHRAESVATLPQNNDLI